MPSQWTSKQPLQYAEIEDLQQEIIRLKRRLSRLERRTDRSTLGRDFNGDRLRSKYATTKDSRSLVPIKSLLPDDDEEGISNDQISSTPPSIEFSFEGYEDPLSKSPSLPVFDEPVYGVYDDDDMFLGVLDVDKPLYDEDQSEPDVQQELFAHNVPKVIEKAEVASPEAMEVMSTGNVEIVGEGVTEFKEGGYVLPIFTGEYKENVHCIGLGTVGLRAAEGARIGVPSKGIPFAYATLKKLKIGRQFGIGWKYPDRFSQPNPPPYGGQPDFFLRARSFLLPG